MEETTLNGSTMTSRTPREEKKSWVRKMKENDSIVRKSDLWAELRASLCSKVKRGLFSDRSLLIKS